MSNHIISSYHKLPTYYWIPLMDSSIKFLHAKYLVSPESMVHKISIKCLSHSFFKKICTVVIIDSNTWEKRWEQHMETSHVTWKQLLQSCDLSINSNIPNVVPSVTTCFYSQDQWISFSNTSLWHRFWSYLWYNNHKCYLSLFKQRNIW